ncbi:carbohydrate-binding module family 13 protein [Mycena floridula]|nr:carbohydrate-binding module family 13 protein [Mycena floridula]
MRSISIAVNFVVLAVLAAAQKPNYRGQLVVEPGLDSGKCLTAASNTNGAVVTIELCTGATNQQWTFTGSGMQVYGTAMCLDVPSGANVNGQKLQIWACSSNNPNQKFGYQYRPNIVSWLNTNKCLDINLGSTTPGTAVQIWQCNTGNPNQVWNVGYHIDHLPKTSEDNQYGTNDCGTTNSATSKCQTAWINSVNDFCLWAPPNVGSIGDTEREEVAWCTKTGRGTRTIPAKTFTGAHFVKTKDYVQITGVGDFTKVNIQNKDEGGELDPHGADGNGNPIGGLVYGNSFGNALQYHEWTSFISYNEFCFRACVGVDAKKNCAHIYDVMGCYWNMPATYSAGVFEDCKGDDTLPMGIYGTSTFHQGDKTTPGPHPTAKSSSCTPYATIKPGPLRRSRPDDFEYIRRAPEPTHL